MRTLAFVLAGLVTLSLSFGVFAQTEEENERFFQVLAEARRAQDNGQHEEAVRLYDEALKIRRDPRIRYFRALSLEALGRDTEALSEFREIREDELVAKYRKEIEARIAALEERIGGAQVVIRTSPEVNASVVINGRPKGTTPLSLTLPRGEYKVLLNARGYRQVSDTIVVTGRTPIEREYNLIPIKTGLLLVECNEIGADVFVDGVWQATTPLRGPLQVEVGERKVRVEKLGMGVKTFDVTISEGKETKVSVVFEAPRRVVEEVSRSGSSKRGWAYGGFATSGVLAATGLGFLVKYGIDAQGLKGGGSRPLGGDFPNSTVTLTGDSLSPTNAMVGGICLGVGILAGVATWLWLWPEE